MSVFNNCVLAKGSIVLVTGVSGFIGSNIADQFLQYGYRVRGTSRDIEKCAWLAQALNDKYGDNSCELVQIENLGEKGAFDRAVKNVSAVIHTASSTIPTPNPHEMITPAIAAALNALRAAYSEPSVRRFVMTSSSAAAALPDPVGPGTFIKKNTWNEDAVARAWADPPYEMDRAMSVYAASKTQAEQQVLKFHRENQHTRPDLVVNTIVPQTNIGHVLDPEKQGYPTTASVAVELFTGKTSPFIRHFVPQYYVDVQDTARLHVAAATLDTVENERIFAYAGHFTLDAILGLLRKNFPGRKFMDNFSTGRDKNEVEEQPRAEQVLRDMGRPGWTSLEDSVLMNVEGLSSENVMTM